MRTFRDVVALLGWLGASAAAGQTPAGTAFTYQGQLNEAGTPLTGTADFQFGLWDALSAGTQIGTTQTVGAVNVNNGLFTVWLDFGPEAFTGDARWLEIAVRSPAGGGVYTTLLPRQELTPAPYATYAAQNWGLRGDAGTAPDLNFLGTTDNQPLVFRTNGVEAMRISPAGEVGIGTDAPGQMLDIRGQVQVQVSIRLDAADEPMLVRQRDVMTSGAHIGFGRWGLFMENSTLFLGIAGADFPGARRLVFGDWLEDGTRNDRMTILDNGHVGIGINDPSSVLTVSGQIESVSGGFRFPDGTVQSSAATAGAAGGRNPMQIALLRWYEANQTGIAYGVGQYPWGVAFDGANIWVANSFSQTVTKLRTSDGAVLGTYPVGTNACSVAFDGLNIWVTNPNANSVTKLRASDGALQGTYNVNCPQGVVFDGASVWVANVPNNTVTKLRPSDGAVQGVYNVGMLPRGLAFDGANIWAANSAGDTVTKLRAADGMLMGTFAVGSVPFALAFDGTSVWVVNANSATVTRLRASDGAAQGTYAVGNSPSAIAFDGANIWVTNQSNDTVTKLRASDGGLQGTYNVQSAPRGVAFDGANIWVANEFGNSVSKL
jgi:hypothetical protein